MGKLRVSVALALVVAGCHGDPAPVPVDDLEHLTRELVDLDHAYWAANQDPTIASELVDVAMRRAPVWDATAATDPVRALAAVVPADIAVALPAAAVPYVELAFDRTDTVSSWIAEDVDAQIATLGVSFSSGAKLSLYLVPGVSRPQQDETFHATGYAHGGVAVVATGTRENHPLTGIQWGNEKLLLVLVNYTDLTQPYTASDVTTQLASTNTFYNTLSNGLVNMTGTVVGPLQSDQVTPCSLDGLYSTTLDVLAKNGYDTDGYNHIVAIGPDAGCGFSGISEIGQALNGRATFSSLNSIGSMKHELGHAHGLYHPHKLVCPGSDLASDESTCAFTEYGHPTDTMASHGGDFDAFGQVNLGYIGRTGYGFPTVVTASGNYSLSPISSAANNTRLIEIPYERDPTSGTSRAFYAEYHTSTGLDSNISGTQYDHTVFVTEATDYDGNSGNFLKALAVGDSFTAPTGLVITATAADDNGATIAVTMPAAQTGCVRATPQIILLQQWYETPDTAGATAQYQIEVWNKDSTECGPSSFEISSPDLPTGWTIVGSNLLAPSGSGLGNGLFYVTSPANATGSQGFTVELNDASVSGHSASQLATFVVSTCTEVSPTVTLAPVTGMTVAAGGTTNYLLSFTNNNDSSCGNIGTNEIMGLGPNGWTVTAENQGLSIGPGSTVTELVTAAAPATATGTNEIGVFIRYIVNGHNYYSKIATASATIGTACVHAPPQITTNPASQTTLASGTELDYTVTVRNLDGPNCAATAPNTISLTSTPPTGITATLDAPSVSLAQGASTTTTLRMTSTTTTPGTYVATVTGSNAGVTATAKASYVLSCGSIVAPQVTVSPHSELGQPGQVLTYGVTIKNPNTSTLCGSRTYTLTSDVTNLNGTTGWTSNLDATTVTLASGASTSTTLTVTSPTNAVAPWAVYQPEVTATDDLGNAKTTSVFYAIECDSNPPTIVLSPSTATAFPGTDVPITATITDNDTYNCPWTMTLGSTLPAQWTESTLPAQLDLIGGQTTQVTWTPHVAASTDGGVYSPKMWIDNAGVQASATATITVACPGHVLPTVSLSPSTQSSAAGGGLDYTVSVKNNDPVGCGTQTFALTDAVPSGWTGSYDNSSIALVPGETQDATLTVTSTASSSGTNMFTATATGTASGAAADTASYVVTCTTAKPGVSISPTTQSAAPGTQLGYTATITNKNSGCAAATITLASSVPSGWTGSVSSPSVMLASQAQTTVTLDATAPTSASGTNTVGLVATGSGSTTGTASFVVLCTHALPTVTLSPTTQSGAAGSALMYTATITNNDVGCTSGTFAVGASVPTGWTGSTSKASVTLASGASTTATLTATSSASATGSNTVGVVASNAASGSTTGTATYVATAACVHAAPTVTIAPLTQSGTAGTALAYTVTVTNNDSAVCATESFAMTRTLPSMPMGWTGTYSSSSLSLAPGASLSSTLTVASPTMVMPNSYTVTATATNASSGSAAANATYVVSSACMRAMPTVMLSPSTQSGVAGTQLTYSATITNNDAGCGSSTFTVGDTVPATWSAMLGQTSVTLGSGASTSVSLAVTSAVGAAANTYSVGVSAQDGASGSGGGSASYVVTTTCTRAIPSISLSPPSQSGTAGTQLTYMATVTNNDTSCGSSTFTMSGSGPVGWTVMSELPSVALASGGSTMVSIDATSAGNAAVTSYSVGAMVSDAASGNASASATYVVAASCARATPTVMIAPVTQSGLGGAALAYDVTVTNNDSACADESFALSSTLPTGWTASFSTTPIVLASGAATTATWTVTSSGTAAAGDTTITAAAVGASSGTGSSNATYTVIPACVRAMPSVAISPPSQTGAPGSQLAYQVTITNNDANCADEMFTLTHAEPVDFNGSFAASVMLASGAQTSTEYDVTSSIATGAGNATLQVTATGTASGSGSGTAIDSVSGTCSRGTASLVLAPSTQIGTAGAPLVYTGTLTNNDVGCMQATFAISAAAPTGWITGLSIDSAPLESGAQATITLTVTSSADAVGDNTVTLVATSPDSGNASANATLSIACNHIPPMVTITPPSQTGSAGSNAMYTVTVTNESTGCATETYTLAATAPDGWTATLGDPAVVIPRGLTGTTTLAVDSASTATAGDYAIDVAADGGTPATATYTVTAETSQSHGCATGGAGSPVAALVIAIGLATRRRRRR